MILNKANFVKSKLPFQIETPKTSPNQQVKLQIEWTLIAGYWWRFLVFLAFGHFFFLFLTDAAEHFCFYGNDGPTKEGHRLKLEE